MVGEDKPRRQTVNESVPEGDKAIVQLVLDVKDRFSHRRWLFEREWYRNILFYLGQQWVV